MVDLSGVVSLDLSAPDFLELGRDAHRIRERFGQGMLAYVAPQGHVYGLLRMYRGQLATSPRLVEIFRDAESARKWLGVAPESTDSEDSAAPGTLRKPCESIMFRLDRTRGLNLVAFTGIVTVDDIHVLRAAFSAIRNGTRGSATWAISRTSRSCGSPTTRSGTWSSTQIV